MMRGAFYRKFCVKTNKTTFKTSPFRINIDSSFRSFQILSNFSDWIVPPCDVSVRRPRRGLHSWFFAAAAVAARLQHIMIAGNRVWWVGHGETPWHEKMTNFKWGPLAPPPPPPAPLLSTPWSGGVPFTRRCLPFTTAALLQSWRQTSLCCRAEEKRHKNIRTLPNLHW